jgi:hypothetical protein
MKIILIFNFTCVNGNSLNNLMTAPGNRLSDPGLHSPLIHTNPSEYEFNKSDRHGNYQFQNNHQKLIKNFENLPSEQLEDCRKFLESLEFTENTPQECTDLLKKEIKSKNWLILAKKYFPFFNSKNEFKNGFTAEFKLYLQNELKFLYFKNNLEIFELIKYFVKLFFTNKILRGVNLKKESKELILTEILLKGEITFIFDCFESKGDPSVLITAVFDYFNYKLDLINGLLKLIKKNKK